MWNVVYFIMKIDNGSEKILLISIFYYSSIRIKNRKNKYGDMY